MMRFHLAFAIAATSLTLSVAFRDTWGLKTFMDPRHHFDPEAQAEALAPIPRLPVKTHSNCRPHVTRIALTGGPGAGKSSVLARIREIGTQHGFDVYAAPEVATLILNSGFRYPADRQDIYTFQRGILTTQLEVERTWTAIAEATGRSSVLIFDRGSLDAKGYMDKEMWNQMLESIPPGSTQKSEDSHITEDYLLSRYDAVLHLVTAANGAEDFYKQGETTDDSGNRVYRRENLTEARELDEKMKSSWDSHPQHIIIDNSGGSFGVKLQRAAAAVLKIANSLHPVFGPNCSDSSQHTDEKQNGHIDDEQGGEASK